MLPKGFHLKMKLFSVALFHVDAIAEGLADLSPEPRVLVYDPHLCISGKILTSDQPISPGWL
jgi:hypothetical protein